MADFEYTKEQVALSSGRPAGSYTTYIDQALKESVMLFKLGTCLAGLADLTEDQRTLVDLGIVKMADAIYLSQPFQAVGASPFSSESIGSYSYSKAAGAVAGGLPTGIFWFDKAVEEVGVCNLTDPEVWFGGIDMGVPVGSGLTVSSNTPGVLAYLSPGELADSRAWGYDPVLTRPL